MTQTPNRVVAACIACLAACVTQASHAQNYHLQRIASGLAQPTYLAQAPGDPPNIVYYSTRITAAPGTGGGFSTANQMGGIFRYDMNTRNSTLVMSLEHRQLVGDEGLVGFVFSPDFNTPGAPGYGKMYVSSSEFNGWEVSPTDRVEEYVVSGPGGTVPLDGMGRPVVNRLILQYDHFNTQQNHTVNWVGFDPLASTLPVGSPERNYLYISAGDGALGASAQDRPEQKANNVQGKVLRVDVDVANGDQYPADPLKNFAIPPSNPIPLWNSTHPANMQLTSTTLNYTTNPMSVTYSPALPEIYMTGLRNTFRMSFDRLTGDWWGGDVGENAREEINFLKYDAYDGNQPPIDFGYAQREGTVPTNAGLGVAGSSGANMVQWNLSGGGTVIVDSTNPVREGPHTVINTPDEIKTTGRSSYIGGYVYRGPIEELQGKYFYTDFVHGNVFMLSDFDRDIPLGSYSGTNFNLVNGVAALGTRSTVATSDVNSLWQSLIIDLTDPTYTPAQGLTFGMGRVVSFAEDNAGNLYVIDFGGNRGDPGFGNDYPHAGVGEIFRLVPNLPITVTVDRGTGAMTFSNETGEIMGIRGYSITSSSGAIDANHLTPITGRLDNSPTGNGDIDDVNAWAVSSAPSDMMLFSESSTGGAAILSMDEGFVLSPGDGWVQSVYEDLRMSVTLGDGSIIPAMVQFTGSGALASPFQRSDLNFNGVLDPGDWVIFRTHHLEDLTGLSRAQSYQFGDMDGDGVNDFADFRIFQADYIAAHGGAAFAALFAVPEPGSAALVVVAVMGGLFLFGRPTNRKGTTLGDFWTERRLLLPRAVALTLACSALASSAHAELRHRYTFNDGTAQDSVGTAHGTLMGNASVSLGVLDLPGGTNDFVSLPGSMIAINTYVDATFEAWFSYRGLDNWQRVFDFGQTNFSGQGRDYIFYTPRSGNNDNRAVISNDGNQASAENRAIGGAPLALNTNHHVAVVVDDASNGGAGRMSLYLDGALAGFVNLTRSMSDVSNSLAYLGRSMWNDPRLNGRIDEFRIYDHALQGADVLASYNAGPTPLELLGLDVNTVTGRVTLVNRANTSLTFDYYRIESDENAIDVSEWWSLDEQNFDAIGTAEGQSWDSLGQPGAGLVAEAFVLGATTLLPGETLDLGHAFDPAVRGLGEDGELSFLFALQGQELRAGVVEYITPHPLAGDYNDNGIVDAADYTVWRDTLGTSLSAADGDGDGVVSFDDHTIWKWSFGNTGGAGATAGVVPEPSGIALLVTSITTLVRRRSKSSQICENG